MRKKYNRFIASFASVALMAGIIGSNLTAAYATTAESDTAMAGVVVSMNNYYANSTSPEEEILNYLTPLAQESETETAASVNAKINNNLGSISGTAAADDLISDDDEAIESGIVSTVGYVNMRKSASTKAPVVGYLYSNCLVSIYDTVENEEGTWYLIESSGIDGYVFSDYVLTGTDAEIAENNIQNKYATVTADELDVYDTAGAGAKVISKVYAGKRYQVLELQGNYVKLASDGVVVGYVSRDGVKITTEFAQALAVDDEFVQERLQEILVEVDDGKRVYDERMAARDYRGALSAIDYVITNLDSYISITEDFELTELKAEAEAQRTAAVSLRDRVAKLVEEEAANASQNIVVPGETETQPTETQTQATEVQPTETQTQATEVQPTETQTQPAATETQPTETQTQPVATETQPIETETQPAATETQPIETETQPVATETQTQATEAVQIVAYEARYSDNAGVKHAGDVLRQSDVFMRITYSDGTVVDEVNVYSPQVGMMLVEGGNVITVWYQDSISSSFELWVAPAETQPTPNETPTQPVTEAPTEAPTQPVTEAPTEAPTQPVTEAPTEAPTQPVTEAPTEAPTEAAVSASRQQVVANALYWVGKCNYVYGGNNLTIGGQVDCSAFTMAMYASVGVGLPRTSAAQSTCGTRISYDQLRPGDLIYYSGHVAIYIGSGQIVHAKNPSSGIVVDSVFFSASQPPLAYITLLP